MPDRRPGDWAPMALAHERPEGLARCLRLPIGARGLHLCARCAGLYPALLAAAAARLGGLDLPFAETPALRLGLPIAGGLGWVVEQAGADLGRPLRVLSGVLLGAGLGWAIGLHVRSPWPAELLELGAALGAALAVGLALGAMRRSSSRPGRGPRKGIDPEPR